MKTFFDIQFMQPVYTEVEGEPSPQCRVSKEWVDWFVDNTGVTREEAYQVGKHWFLGGVHIFNYCRDRQQGTVGIDLENTLPRRTLIRDMSESQYTDPKGRTEAQTQNMDAMFNGMHKLRDSTSVDEERSKLAVPTEYVERRSKDRLNSLDLVSESNAVVKLTPADHDIDSAKLTPAVQKALAFMAKKRPDDLADILFHCFDPSNVWNFEHYVDRTLSGSSVGQDCSLKFRYVRGSAFVNGYIGNTSIRIYYSNLQGFQVYHAPLGEKPLEGDGIVPSTFRTENIVGVYEFIAFIVKHD
jgi:hypothetical protein